MPELGLEQRKTFQREASEIEKFELKTITLLHVNFNTETVEIVKRVSVLFGWMKNTTFSRLEKYSFEVLALFA